MKKIGILLWLFMVACSSILSAKTDSLFFYKSGKIVFGYPLTDIDSVTFVPIDYYALKDAETVFKTIQSMPELSIFAEMLQKAGYEKKLDYKTIWAPVNGALAGVDLNDLTAVRKILDNHISDKAITTTALLHSWDGSIRMLNLKKLYFTGQGTDYQIGGAHFLQADICAVHSIIHTLKEKIPYPNNIWEFITLPPEQGDGMDTLRSFVRSINKASNDILTYLGKLDDENDYSYCTAILPTDQACLDAYNKLFPYCKAPLSQGGLTKQIENTKWMIVRDLFFKGSYRFPFTDSTLTSTFGTMFNHPNTAFGGITSTIWLSNGMAHRLNHLRQYDSIDVLKPVKIEAESVAGIYPAHLDTMTISNSDTNFDISNGRYLRCLSNATSFLQKVELTFSLMNLKPHKYAVYAVFVPSCLDDSTDSRPYKLNFIMTYIDSTGQTKTNLLLQGAVTNPSQVTKIQVAKEVNIPYYAVVHNPNTNPLEKFKIVSSVLSSEKEIYSRSFRVDYILLEPLE
ncbi:MAG: fasciclin domain-containing protein [Bacteroidota bacterium]|nr:fasciclin domain-containing protein [Bacteroidota bacterium]